MVGGGTGRPDRGSGKPVDGPGASRQHRAMRLTGGRVVLRPIVADDVDDLVALFAEPEVARWWHGYDHDRIVRELVEEDDPDTTIYAAEVDGELAGVIQSWEERDPDY